MEHVVFYTGRDRTPQFRRMPSIDEAVRFVESLRNGEGIDDSQVYSLNEVPLRFQTYYRVEVPSESGAPTSESASTPSPPASAAAPAPELAAPPVAEPTGFAPAESTVSPEPVPVFEPAATAETTSAPVAVAAEALPPAPAVEILDAGSSEAAVPDLLNGPAGGDDPEAAAANGKPHRGLGFFAR